MRPGIELLVAMLRGHPAPDDCTDPAWGALLEAAGQESLLPWLAERLETGQVALNLEQAERIKAIRREAQIAAFVWMETLKRILSAFHRENVQVIPLKGPSAAERLYGDAALRTCHDLDLLVRSRDVSRGECVLAGLGFARSGYPDDYQMSWCRNGLTIELHHNVENPRAFDFDVDAAWESASLSEFHGIPVWLLAPSDELLYLCLHAVHHRFDRLCLVLDLVQAFRRVRFMTSSRLPQRGSYCGNALVLGWAMAAQVDPQMRLPEGTGVSTQEQRRLQELARRLWKEHLLEAPQTLDWVAQHRFYLDVETPGWRRVLRHRRHLGILLTRVIDADFEFAERFRMRRRWQVRLLRPVRLLTNKVHSSFGNA